LGRKGTATLAAEPLLIRNGIVALLRLIILFICITSFLVARRPPAHGKNISDRELLSMFQKIQTLEQQQQDTVKIYFCLPA